MLPINMPMGWVYKSLIVSGLIYSVSIFADSTVTINSIVQKGGGNSLVIGAGSSDFISGSGKRQELLTTLRKYDAIQTYISAEINIKQGEEFNIKLSGDDNILPLIKFNIEDETLKLYSEKSFSSKNPLTVELSLGGLKKLLANGSGDIHMIDLNGEKLQVELNGSGEITASGAISQLNVVLQGSGDMDFRRMKSKNCDVLLNGSGDIAVYAEQSIDAKISGAGDISVTGNPGKVTKSINGAGTITFQ